MRMVTRPNELIAVCMTAAPSVTDEVSATALPPAGHVRRIISPGEQNRRLTPTLLDLFDHLLSRLSIEVIHDHVSTTRGKEK